MEDKIRVQGDQFVLINTDDSKDRNIVNGDKVKVFNDRGSNEGIAKISDDVSKGIIVSTLGYWSQHNKGTANVLVLQLSRYGKCPNILR